MGLTVIGVSFTAPPPPNPIPLQTNTTATTEPLSPLHRLDYRKDKHKSFTDVLFYGNELSLFMMQVLVFACIDMRLHNAAFSGGITYLVMWIVGFLRNEWGENNLSQKSLIDKKFLI